MSQSETTMLKMKYIGFVLTNKGRKDNSPTPKNLYEQLDREFHFDFDPRPLNGPELRERDGLGDWGTCNFVNPPYSKKVDWIKKAILEQTKGHLSVLLIPADTSTNWFHELVAPNAEIRFIKGRVMFTEKTHASFPTMICVFKPKPIAERKGEKRA